MVEIEVTITKSSKILVVASFSQHVYSSYMQNYLIPREYTPNIQRQ